MTDRHTEKPLSVRLGPLRAWIEQESAATGQPMRRVVLDAIETYRYRLSGQPVTVARGHEVYAGAGAIVHAREGVIVHLPGGGSLRVGRRGDVTLRPDPPPHPGGKDEGGWPA